MNFFSPSQEIIFLIFQIVHALNFSLRLKGDLAVSRSFLLLFSDVGNFSKKREKRRSFENIFHSPSKFNSPSLIRLIAFSEAKTEVDKCCSVQVSFSIVELNIYFAGEKSLPLCHL
jgi:hypothetical protein